MIPLPFSHHYQWSPSIHRRPGIWMLLTITQPFGLRHPTVHCLLVSCICALLQRLRPRCSRRDWQLLCNQLLLDVETRPRRDSLFLLVVGTQGKLPCPRSAKPHDADDLPAALRQCSGALLGRAPAATREPPQRQTVPGPTSPPGSQPPLLAAPLDPAPNTATCGIITLLL